MKFKKLAVALLALSLLLSACGKKNENTDSGNNNDSSITDILPGDTNTENSGDTAGENTGDTTGENTGDTTGGDAAGGTAAEGENPGDATNEDTGASSVDKVESADDAISFIDANVYSQCPDVLPMMVMTQALSTEDMESITYHTGLTDTSGITDIILSESGVGSIAYSLVYLRTDGTNTAELQTALGESIDPQKWVCVTAEYIASVTLDNDIILIMGTKDQVDTIMNAVTTAAEGVFENVGSVVTF